MTNARSINSESESFTVTTSAHDPDDMDLETRLNGQTAQIHWLELQRYFARGVVRQVAVGMDLITVGRAIIDNENSTVQAWLDAEVLTVPDEGRAQRWFDANTKLWALVVAPWVLVQESD